MRALKKHMAGKEEGEGPGVFVTLTRMNTEVSRGGGDLSELGNKPCRASGEYQSRQRVWQVQRPCARTI